LQALCGPNVTMVETGAPVARRTRQVLEALPRPETRPVVVPGVTLLSTGDPEPLARAAQRWLGLKIPGQHLAC
jgi:glutamate racemase